MNTYQKTYLALFAIVFLGLGVCFYTKQAVKSEKKITRRIASDLRKFKVVANQVYHYQQTVRLNEKVLTERSKGDLEMSNILELTGKHGLKSPSNYATDVVNKRTYRENKVSILLKNEKLKSIVEFLSDVEKLGDSNVKNLTFIRSPKNKDKWNASLSIVKIIPKEL